MIHHPTSSRKIFSSTCEAGRKKIYAGTSYVFGVSIRRSGERNWFPHKIAFPRLAARKSNFCGMTLDFGAWSAVRS
jgi:hypothetical protein